MPLSNLLLRASLGYLACVVLVSGSLRYVGEQLWATAVALYLPRACFALPAPVLIFFAVRDRKAWPLVLSCAAGCVSVFGLMGYTFPTRAATPSEVVFKVYTQNVASLDRVDLLLSKLRAIRPEVVLLQEAGGKQSGSLQIQLPEYAWHQRGPFLFGSRFPVASVQPVWEFSHIKYGVIVDGRPVTFVNIHPRSPSHAYKQVLGMPQVAAPERWRTMNPLAVVSDDARLRTRALKGIAASVADEQNPVVVAGDSNSPGLSWALSENLGHLTDAFEFAGLGFGYTFPDSPVPWMRIDRVFVTHELTVEAAQVLGAGASDHRALLVTLGLGSPR